jgi:hypothetical protein
MPQQDHQSSQLIPIEATCTHPLRTRWGHNRAAWHCGAPPRLPWPCLPAAAAVRQRPRWMVLTEDGRALPNTDIVSSSEYVA